MRVQYYAGTCNLQPVTAYRSVDGISRLLIERAPDWHAGTGRGSAHFLEACKFYCSCDMGLSQAVIRLPQQEA